MLLAVFSIESMAQITITSSHMPKSGDTIRYSEAPLTDLPDLTKTGTNYTWDYEEMGMNRQAIYEYKASFRTPYIINFGFSAIGLKIADSLGTGQLALQNVYNFFKNSSSQWETVGVGFQYSTFPLPQSGKYSKTDKIYEFPLKYNNKYSNDFAAKIPITLTLVPVGDFFITGNRTTEVDGWGKITTPYADEVDCIRIKSVIEEVDSISISSLNINIGIPTKRVEYKWLSTSERIPILEISGTEVLGNFVPTYIRYRDTFRTPKSRLDVTADFEVDTRTPSTNDTVTLTDKSEGPIIFREWTITPTTYNFVNGTDENSTNPQLQFTKAGRYTVQLNVSNVAFEDSLVKVEYITVNQGASVPELGILSNEIYPNPFINTLEITINQPNTSTFVKLFAADGRLILEEELRDQEHYSIPTSHFEAGIYFLEMSQNGQLHRKKLLKIKH